MDPYDPLGPLNRFLAGSWRLFHLFGSEIRVYWTAGLVFLVSIYQVSRWPGVGLPEAVLWGFLFQAGLYVVVLTHEFAHAAAARLYRIPTPKITLSALGGLAHAAEAPPGPKADIVISIAGPLSHAVWIGLAWALRDVVPLAHVGEFGLPVDVCATLMRVNVFLALFNLLPFFPMDGGRVLRGLLALRRHGNWAALWAARVGAVGAIGFLAWGMSTRGFEGTILLFIGLANLQVCLREMTMARYGEGPYGAPRDAWASDADAWRRGENPFGRVEGGPVRTGLLARWRARARVRRLAADERPPAPLAPPPAVDPGEDAELDRLLAKVGEVGLPGLSDAERAALRRISEARRSRRS